MFRTSLTSVSVARREVTERLDLFELRSGAEQQIFAAVRRGELDTDRQALAIVEQRDRARRLTGRVEQRGERREVAGVHDALERIVAVRRERAERHRRRRHGRCQPKIVALEERTDLARDAVDPRPRRSVRRRLDHMLYLVVLQGELLDLVGGEGVPDDML